MVKWEWPDSIDGRRGGINRFGQWSDIDDSLWAENTTE